MRFMVSVAGFRKYYLVFWISWALNLPFPALAGEVNILRFKNEVMVMTRTFSLADIANLAEIEPNTRIQLSEVEIGRTPRPGHLTQVTRVEVNASLEQVYPGISKRVQWEGPAFVQVRGGGVLCDADALSRSAYDLLRTWIQREYGQGSVQMVGPPIALIVALGEVSFRPKLSPAIRLNKRMQVWVDVLVGGHHFQTVPLWFSVSVHAPALVVKSAMKKHQELTFFDVTEEKIDITGVNGNPINYLSLAGKRVLRDLGAGAVLTDRDVEMTPAVSRGELITVYAKYGTVSLSAQGVALMDGNLWQRIDVKNPSSGESYRATVTGRNEAMVN